MWEACCISATVLTAKVCANKADVKDLGSSLPHLVAKGGLV